MSGKVFRVVVESYPTEDGRPFVEQDPAWWNQLVTDIIDEKETLPAWLPSDFDEYVYAFVPDDEQPKSGRRIAHKGRVILAVPALFKKFFWVQKSAERQVRMLVEWGCVARVETAEIGPWMP